MEPRHCYDRDHDKNEWASENRLRIPMVGSIEEKTGQNNDPKKVR
jgi:hypothetical protein